MADTFSVRLPDDLRAEVDRLAESQRRSRAFIIKEAVEAYVADQQAYEDAIKEALAEAEKGAFISADKTLEWLDQLGVDAATPAPTPDIFKK